MESIDVRLISADTAVSLGDDMFLIDGSGGNINLTLPNMTGLGEGKIYFFKRTDQIGDKIVTITPTATTIDGVSNLILGIKQDVTLIFESGIWKISEQVGMRTPFWVHINKTHTDFQAPATTNDIEIFILPTGWIMQGVVIKQSVQFAGGLIITYTLSVGIAGNLTKYASAFLVSTAPSNTNFQVSQNFFVENFGAGTSVRSQAVSTGANLDQSTQGDVDFYLLISQVIH